MHTISSYLGNRPTSKRPPARPLQTHRQDRKQYTAPLSLARSVMMGLAGRERSLTIYRSGIHECDRQTDGRTDGRTPGDSKDRANA